MSIVPLRGHRAALPIPADACRILRLTDETMLNSVSYCLRRCKNGTEIMLTVRIDRRKALSWNVSAMTGHWPRSFTEARQWIEAYAGRYGHEVIETLPPNRKKRAPKEDRAVLNSGGCREAWLSADYPDLYAEACLRCRHPGGFCSQDGYCHYGDCDMEMMPLQAEQAEVE